jgi:hypothetical protein
MMRRAARWLGSVALLLAAGCSSPKEPPTGSGGSGVVHLAGWSDPASDEFHGTNLSARGYPNSECRVCHGNDYDGGLVGVSCRECHPSYPHGEEGWIDGHSQFVRDNGWDIIQCRPCHGEDYSIRKVEFSCLSCHHPDGPESCNACHGDFPGDPWELANSAPPAGLLGETDSLALPVGAHAAHMNYDSTRTAAEICSECHIVPVHYEDPGHIDGQPGAEVVLGGSRGLIATEGGARVPAPTWDRASATCAGTYCHGNWGLLAADSDFSFIYTGEKIEGSSASPSWIDPGTADCGSCHGLPPVGHDPAALSACGGCHEGVVDGSGVIMDASLHGNGQVNVFGTEYPMF